MKNIFNRRTALMATRMTRRDFNTALGSLALGSAFGSSAQAQDGEAFYRGRQLTLIVGYGTGGGFDVYARLVGRHMTGFIAGQPNVMVQNMPGAGSLRAVNYLYNVAPKDGTTFSHFGRNMIMLGALKNSKNVMFEPDKLTWLGSSSSFQDDAYILIVREDAPFKTIADVTRADGPRLIIGGSAEGSTSNDVPVILADTIGLRFQMVKGYPDSAALNFALEKNEIQARMVDLSGIRTTRPDWLKPGGGYRVLVQFGRETRHPDLASAPTARELAINDAARTLIILSELPYKFSRPFAAPPNLPPERAAILQKAFMATHTDPAFLEEAIRAGLDISPVGPEAVAASIREIERAPVEVLDYLRKLFSADKA
jgi:tripartite-type tricarboxylate transporter receptor subunit TctC